MNQFLHTKMKLIPGYPSAQDYVLAASRGETDGGTSTFIGLSQLYSRDINEKNLNIVVQLGSTRSASMPDIPTVLEMTTDAETQQMFTFLSGSDDIGRSIFTTPNVPADRLAQLRSAFDLMVADGEFIAEAGNLHLPLSTRNGQELQRMVEDSFVAAPGAMAKITELLRSSP